MTDYKGSNDPHGGLTVPEYFARILKSKDRIIRAQAKRIESLEGDVQRLRLTRETLNTQLALLSYKLQLATGDWDQNVAGGAAESKIGQSVSRLRGNSYHGDKRPAWNSSIPEVDSLRAKDSLRVGQSGLSQREGDREFGKLGLELCDGLSHLVDRYAKRNDRTPTEGVARKTVPGENEAFLSQFECDSLDAKHRNFARNPLFGELLQEEADESIGGNSFYEDSLASCIDDVSVSVDSPSPCSSPVRFNVDQPSFCFENQLEEQALKDKTEGGYTGGYRHGGAEDGVGNQMPVSGMPKLWSPFYGAYGDAKMADSSDLQCHLYGYKPAGAPSLHLGLPPGVFSKYVNQKGLLGSPPGEYNAPHQCGGRCKCCSGTNSYARGANACQESQEKGVYDGQGRWKAQTGGAYLLPTLPARFAHLSSSRSSPIWKRKGGIGYHDDMCANTCDHSKRLSELTEFSEQTTSTDRSTSSEHLGSLSGGSDSMSLGSGDAQSNRCAVSSSSSVDGECCSTIPNQLNERQKKRLYRIGLNLFNRKPDRGIAYLVEHRFLESSPLDVAKFLISRKGLSKQTIGEYLGNLQSPFNMEVLSFFVAEINLSGLQIDEALRKFQSSFQMPGEAQKIERLMEAFARSYSDSNPEDARKFRNPDAIFLLAYAIVMLNTDLHNSNVKPDKKMKLKDFVRNFRGIDGNNDIDEALLSSIYNNISANPLQPTNDHVTQVMKVDQMIVGQKPQLVLPYRRLICYCRLSEIQDPAVKSDRGSNQHLREVFLFNDMLVVTKLLNKKKNSIQYSYRQSFLLFGMMILLFETPHYKYGIQLASSFDRKVLMNFVAQDEQDRKKFIEDLQEAILEVNEMEAIRTQESEVDQMGDASYSSLKRCRKASSADPDVEMFRDGAEISNLLLMSGDNELKNNSLCGSIVNISEGCRRLSSGSLDSGLPSVSSGSMGSVQDRTSSSKFNIYRSASGKIIKSTQHLDDSEL